MKILIVDDDKGIQKVLSLRMRAEGYEVTGATSAEEAYRFLGLDGGVQGESPFDLVLMDILMPDIPGIEACRRIKAEPSTRDVPVILMTGSSDSAVLKDAFDAGAMDFLSKPFNSVELLVRIRSALRLKSEINRRKQRERELTALARELQEVNSKLARLSMIDSLTGLYNRRYFDGMLNREFQRAMRTGSPLSLIMIDVDAFKYYNDRYGHQAGDDCLRRIAQLFKGVVSRSHDLVARFGGEEFVVVLPETPVSGATALGETLRKEVLELAIRHEASPVADVVTISLGAATVAPSRESQASDLVAQADRALYQSKSQGRNRLTVG